MIDIIQNVSVLMKFYSLLKSNCLNRAPDALLIAFTLSLKLRSLNCELKGR